MKEVKIGNETYKMSASVLTMANYSNIFGMEESFAKDYSKLVMCVNEFRNCYETSEDGKRKVKPSQMQKAIELSATLLLIGTKMAYAMIKEEDINFMSYNDWAKKLNGIAKDLTWVDEVVGIASSVF